MNKTFSVSMFRSAQVRFILLVLGIWLAVFTLTRTVLFTVSFSNAQAGLGDVLRFYGIGLMYDLVFLIYAGLPLAVCLLVLPRRWWGGRTLCVGLRGVLVLSVFLMLFVAVAEWIFWDEFGTRFNFIAVDYLVYTHEVINNILESYPVSLLLGGLFVLAVGMVWLLGKPFARTMAQPSLGWKAGGGLLAAWLALVVGCAAVVGQGFPAPQGGNAWVRQLAGNGPYQFFAAFRNNELNYKEFYAERPDAEVGRLLRAEVAEPNARFLDKGDGIDIRRTITATGEPRRHNVILVSVESLSASFLGHFGNTQGLTPNLDALYDESLVFTNFYATGTRTDRGLEAITLAVPPTPGRSIVKRIGREKGYASLGQQLVQQGYDSVFLYGGRGFFDNMNAFFSGNGYRIVDQTSVPESEIYFKNAWGMADEVLFRQVLKTADEDFSASKPFFFHVMTTSNHRPYTYPDGRIDLPSHTSGRNGAVKYTDFAIGEFLREARKKPWFANTIFVILADHCAGSAGKEDLPVRNYHIPMFIYAPGIVQPGEYTKLASQIDVAPTVLGLLNFSYESTFFGRDLLLPNSNLPPRALIGTYQHLGLFDGKDLAILSPMKLIRRHDDALGASREAKAQADDALVDRDIAYFQGASHAFTAGDLNWKDLQTLAGEKAQ